MQFHRSVVLLCGASLALLAGLVVTLIVARQPEAVYAPNSPQATVAGFLRLLERGEVDRAYALTTQVAVRQSFHQQFGAWRDTSHRATLVGTSIHGNTAEVTVYIKYASGGAIGLPEQTYQSTFMLERQGGTWRISNWLGFP